MSQLCLDASLRQQAPGVRDFLVEALRQERPELDGLVAAGVPHYTARSLLRRLNQAGEIDAGGWVADHRQAYAELLAPPARLQRSRPGERPREKAQLSGIASLADAELLGLLLRTGSRGEGVLEFAQRLLDDHDGLLGLAGQDVAELLQVGGMGPAKAAEIAAAFELGRRLAQARRRQRPALTTPETVAALLREDLVPLPHEEFWCLPLDARSRLIGEPRVVSKGDIDGTDAAPRAFFRLALQAQAASAIAVHNHPTGEVGPSRADRQVTRTLVAAGRLVGIPVVDHLILGDDGRFTSLRREQPALFRDG